MYEMEKTIGRVASMIFHSRNGTYQHHHRKKRAIFACICFIPFPMYLCLISEYSGRILWCENGCLPNICVFWRISLHQKNHHYLLHYKQTMPPYRNNSPIWGRFFPPRSETEKSLFLSFECFVLFSTAFRHCRIYNYIGLTIYSCNCKLMEKKS